jgi:cobalt-zinc-cadmium efflux system outer membrane protein
MTYRLFLMPIALSLLLAGVCLSYDQSLELQTLNEAAAAPYDPNRVQGPPFPENPTLQDCLWYALRNNPSLVAIHADWEAAKKKIAQAKSLPDPRLGYSYRFAPRGDNMRRAIELEQMLPWFGRLDLQGQAASAAADVVGNKCQVDRLKLFNDIKAAWYEYYFLGKSIESVTENITLVKSFEEIAMVRYQTSKASQQDVIRAQIERATLENQLRSLQDLQSPAAAKVNAVMGRPSDAPLAWPQDVADEGTTMDNAELQKMLVQENPELLAAQGQINQSRKEIDIADKGYYPDITVGVEYADWMGTRDMDQRDAYTGKISINLPIWRGRISAGVDEMRQRHRATVAMKQDIFNSLSAELKMAAYSHRDAQRKVKLYNDSLIPKQKEAIAALQRSYQAGSASFLELIDAQRTLLEFEISYHRALADRAISLARIEMLTGRGL